MGFDTTWFVNKIDDSFKCSICLEVFKDPVMIEKCEHIYCRDCIRDWLSKNTYCPEDRAAISERNLVKPHRFFCNLYDKLEVKCELGCSEILLLAGYERHLKECRMARQHCSKNCGFEGSKIKLDSHDCVLYLLEKNANLMKELSIAKKDMPKPVLSYRVPTIMEEIDDAKKAIADLFLKIDYNEGRSNLEPHFILVGNESSLQDSQFRYEASGLDNTEKESLLAAVVKSIQGAKDSYSEISSAVHQRSKEVLKQGMLHICAVNFRYGYGLRYHYHKAITVHVVSITVVVVFYSKPQ